MLFQKLNIVRKLNILKLVKAFALSLTIISALGLVGVSLSSCNGQDKRGENEIVIGTLSGPDLKLVLSAKETAEKEYGLSIKIVEFEDYVMPNRALSEGNIDMNIFQHQPYLDLAIKKDGLKLHTLAKTFIFPMGIYSKKHTSLNDIPEGATVGIPNDPSNGARSLLLLETAGLIKLNTHEGWDMTPANIESNPKKLVFKSLDASLLPTTLHDVDFAVINTNFAVPAGLYPSKHALLKENALSPYANIIVVRQGEESSKKLNDFVKAFQTEKTVKLAQELFDNEAIKAW